MPVDTSKSEGTGAEKSMLNTSVGCVNALQGYSHNGCGSTGGSLFPDASFKQQDRIA